MKSTETEPTIRTARRPSAGRTKMRRYRLTFDANPKELASRDAGGGSHVILLWSRRTGRAAVVVEDVTGEVVEVDVRERENPLELFNHPYVYLPRRGHPGRRSPDHELAAA